MGGESAKGAGAETAARPGAGPSAATEATEVGVRLRGLRALYGISQRELARRTGVANGTISLVEQGQVSPSVASLKRLLAGFPVSLADFFTFELPSETRIAFRAQELPELAGGKLSYRLVAAGRPHAKLQVLHERYAPDGDTGEEMLSHAAEEAGVVVRGEIQLTVGGRTATLRAGDAYYFDSRLPHRFRNAGAEDCEIVSVCTPPSF